MRIYIVKHRQVRNENNIPLINEPKYTEREIWKFSYVRKSDT